MRLRFIIGLLIGLLIAMSAVAGDVAQPKFKRVVIFGDSLSDNGNLFRHTAGVIPAYPAYFNGRFSNGYVWSDDVTYQLYQKYFIPSDNFAVGGATAILHNPFGGYLPVTLSMEYDDYIAQNLTKNKDNTLFVIWIGANDYLPGNKDVDTVTTNVVNGIVSVVKKLAAIKGAQFFIADLPDLAVAPVAKERGLADNYAQLATAHDKKLHAAIAQLKKAYPQTQFIEFDFKQTPLLKKLVTDPSYRAALNKQYGVNLTNVTQACLTGYLKNKNTTVALPYTDAKAAQLARLIQKTPSLLEAYQMGAQLKTGDVSTCQNPDQHVFWDHMHPTSVVHQILSKIFLKVIMSSQ